MKILGFVNGDGPAALLNTAPLVAAVQGLMPAPYALQANAPPDGSLAPCLDPRVPAFVFAPIGTPAPRWNGDGPAVMSEAAVGRGALWYGTA